MNTAGTISRKRSNAWSRVYLVLRMALFVVILAYLGWQIVAGRHVLAAVDLEWHPYELALSFALGIVAYQALFVAWLLLLRRTGLYQPRHLRSYSRIWWVSFMYRYVPGKIFLLVERVRLGLAADIPHAAGAAMPVVESLLSLVAGCVVSLLSVSYYASHATATGAGILALIGVTVFVVPPVFRWTARIPAIGRRYPQLASMHLGTVDLLVLLTPYILHYLLFGLAFFLLARCTHPLAWSDLPGLCGIYALSTVASIVVIFAPGGIGVREGALAIQLQSLVPASVAGVLAIGVRLWFTLAELTCLLFVVVACPPSRESGSTDELRSSA